MLDDIAGGGITSHTASLSEQDWVDGEEGRENNSIVVLSMLFMICMRDVCAKASLALIDRRGSTSAKCFYRNTRQLEDYNA